MDLRVEWSPEAVEDLESILKYIARDSGYYASSVAAEILSISRSTGEFPQIGRVVPEVGDDTVRERFVYSYRLVYKIEQDRVLIVAVIHGKRLLEAISERFEQNA